MSARTILIMGPPGAGKGTQASNLVDTYGLEHLATGDVLRQAVNAGTDLGLQAKEYMNKGELVPDDVIIGMLRDLIAGLDGERGVLLDGFPRTVAQAEALESTLDSIGRSVDVALDITVPNDELLNRLASRWICKDCQTPFNANSNPPAKAEICDHCGGPLYQRDDDTPEAVRQRLQVYADQTAPVSAFYADRGLRSEIDGNQQPAAVQTAIDEAISAPAGA